MRVVETWPNLRIEHTKEGTGILSPPYDGVARILFGFSDNFGLPPVTANGHTRVSADLASSRLTSLIVEFAELTEGTPEPFVATLRDEYGAPVFDGQPRPTGPFGTELRMDRGLAMVTSDQRNIVWAWPNDDRVVVLHIKRYGKEVFPEKHLESYVVRLQLMEGQFRRIAVEQTLQRFIHAAQQTEARRAVTTLRDGIAQKSGPHLEKSDTDELSDTLPVPAALLGTWVIRGREKYGHQWIGTLTIKPTKDERVATGVFEWLEGLSLGKMAFTATIAATGEARIPVVIFRGTSIEPVLGRVPLGLYVAALNADARMLSWGQFAEPGRLHWEATKVTEATPANQAGRSPGGTWRIQGGIRTLEPWNGKPTWEAILTLRDHTVVGPLRTLRGTCASEGRESTVFGVFNIETQRVWLRSVPTTELTEIGAEAVLDDPLNGVGGGKRTGTIYEAYLSADGNQLTNGRCDWGNGFPDFYGASPWRGIRDDLIPPLPPNWVLHLPNITALHPNDQPRATATLEGLLEWYAVDLAVPTSTGGYVRTERSADGNRKIVQIAELPPDRERLFQFALNDSYRKKTFTLVLQSHGLPPTNSVVLIIPSSMKEQMRVLEVEHLKTRLGITDLRRIQATEFQIDYDVQTKHYRLRVKSLTTAKFLGW